MRRVGLPYLGYQPSALTVVLHPNVWQEQKESNPHHWFWRPRHGHYTMLLYLVAAPRVGLGLWRYELHFVPDYTAMIGGPGRNRTDNTLLAKENRYP